MSKAELAVAAATAATHLYKHRHRLHRSSNGHRQCNQYPSIQMTRNRFWLGEACLAACRRIRRPCRFRSCHCRRTPVRSNRPRWSRSSGVVEHKPGAAQRRALRPRSANRPGPLPFRPAAPEASRWPEAAASARSPRRLRHRAPRRLRTRPSTGQTVLEFAPSRSTPLPGQLVDIGSVLDRA